MCACIFLYTLIQSLREANTLVDILLARFANTGLILLCSLISVSSIFLHSYFNCLLFMVHDFNYVNIDYFGIFSHCIIAWFRADLAQQFGIRWKNQDRIVAHQVFDKISKCDFGF